MKNLIFLFLGLLAGCCNARAIPDGEWAVINTSCVFMRSEASYTSENVSQSRMGTPVQVLERSGYWAKIRTPEPYEGWVNELTLAPLPEDYRTSDRYLCIAEHSHVFAEPSSDAERLSDLSMSDILRSGDGAADGWLPVQLWDGRPGWVKADELAGFDGWMTSAASHASKASQTGSAGSGIAADGIAEEVVATARLFLGAPYLWGGMSAGLFDCSGLVGFCYFMAGIQLPRDASRQIKCGVPVEFADMQAGDLVFFGEKRASHVAICTGPGRIIHSSQIVRENSLIAGEPDYYGRNILGIRRIIGNLQEKELVKNSPLYF